MSQNHSHCHFRYAFELLLNEHAHVSLPRSGRSDYMRGVIPPHEFTPVTKMCFHIHPGNRNPSLYNDVRSPITSTPGYTRVPLRLRAQAEKQAGMARTKPPRLHPSPLVHFCLVDYKSQHIRLPESKRSTFSTFQPCTLTYAICLLTFHIMGDNRHRIVNPRDIHLVWHSTLSQTSLALCSPLFRLRPAPPSWVFVPSIESRMTACKNARKSVNAPEFST